MNENNNQASRIVKCRKERMQEEMQKALEKQKENLEYTKECVKKILDVFEASNSEENTSEFVYKVCLQANGDVLKCKVSFERDVEDVDLSKFFDVNFFESENTHKEVKSAIANLNMLEISLYRTMMISNFFNEHLKDYFLVTTETLGTIVITIKEDNLHKNS